MQSRTIAYGGLIEARTFLVDESQIDPSLLEPSEEFARLLGRVGDQAGIGRLGLGAIRTLVKERAANSHPQIDLEKQN